MAERSIPLSVPNLQGRELELVTKAVETEWVSTAGPYVAQFENKIAEYVNAPGAVACQSGTAGLHIALKLCGVMPHDLVIVPTLTFIAAVNPVRYQGADPVFMDCDDSLCMDPVKLEEFCKEECELRDKVLYHKATGRRIPAMTVVHVFGNMADMETIMAIADKYCLKVIEDATEALGTRYLDSHDGKYAGRYAGTMGDIGVYSFNGNKIITTGGGGMIVSEDEELLKRAKHLTTQAKADAENFVHDEIGYNYRLTNLQAALGVAQLEQLEEFIRIKTENHEIYRGILDGKRLNTKNIIKNSVIMNILPFREDIRSNHWFYSLYLKENGDCGACARDEVIAYLKELNIQTRPIWGLIHEQKPYEGSICHKIEKAVEYQRRVVNLPCSSSLTGEDAEYVARRLMA